MDPPTIVAGSFALLGVCTKLSNQISSFLNKAGNADMAIGSLAIEIETLSGVLRDMNVNFNEPPFTTTELQESSLRDPEQDYWERMSQAIADCNETLKILEQLLHSVKQGEGLFMRGSKLQARLQRHSEKINLLKQQIAAYRRTLALSLQFITV
jgi:hypothetical protein